MVYRPTEFPGVSSKFLEGLQSGDQTCDFSRLPDCRVGPAGRRAGRPRLARRPRHGPGGTRRSAGDGRRHQPRARHDVGTARARRRHVRGPAAAARRVPRDHPLPGLPHDRGRAGRGRRRRGGAGRRGAPTGRGGGAGDRRSGQPAAQDRPRRRVDDAGARAVAGAAQPRPQLHPLPAADARSPAPALAARAIREPAGLAADHGQRPALQRHRLPARRHRQPGADPRHRRDQPEPGVDRRGQGHLAELRRGVRPGGGRRRLGADPLRDQPLRGQRVRAVPGRSLPGPQPVHPAARRGAAGEPAPPVRRGAGRTDPPRPRVLLRRLPGPALDRGATRGC